MSSQVWTYFKIDEADDKYAKCNLCLKRILRGGSTFASKSTSNLINHLKTHKINLKSQNVKSETSKLSSSSRPSSLLSFVHKSSRPTFTETSKSPQSEVEAQSGPSVGSQDLTIPNTSMPTDTGSSHDDLGLSQRSQQEQPAPSFSQHLNIDIPNQPFVLAHLDTSPDVDDPSEESSSTLSTTSTSPRGPSYPKKIKLAKTKQLTLPNLADRMKKFKHSDTRAIQLNKLIAGMICKDLQPISVVENVGFRRLINYLEPRYTIPTRKTFQRKILVDMYNSVLKQVQDEMMNITSVAITTDMWTNICQIDFMAVTAHFVSDGLRDHKCLEVIPFPEVSHTGVNLKNFLIKVLEDWNLKDKVVAVVRDNGPDITSALDRSEFSAVPCVAHTLQLVVKDGFFNNPKVTNVVAKAKKLVGSFKHSAKNTKTLKSTQNKLNLPQHKMIQDEPTRWNSTYYMLRRLHEQKQAIILVSANPDVKLSVEMTNEDWKTIEFAVDILEIFETATLQLSKETASISEIIPMINTIHHVLETRAPQGSGLQGLKNDLLASLKRRYNDVEGNVLYACATVLDPRFKATPFKNEDKLEVAKVKLLQELRDGFPPATEAEDSSSATSGPAISQEEEMQSKSKTGFWHHYREAFGKSSSTTTSTNPTQAAESEMAAYLTEPTCFDPKDSDKIVNYWNLNQNQNLKKLAFKYQH